ncbi:MAG: alkene reductase [Marinomonas sp.]
MKALFDPVKLGDLNLQNRIIMAPMTRDRAGPDDVPNDIMVQYYAQRASAGMIITEGTQPNRAGKGYWRTPGIHSDAQVAGWARVADAVHARGGLIAMQIMHCGRVVVEANRGFEADIIAPSALNCPDKVPGPDGVPAETAAPRELSAKELPALAQEFAQAAVNARKAGMDMVELHCATGYLINQFLNPASNQRGDEFGGSPENRIRFPLMVLKAMADAIGSGRVGFRIAPGNPYNGMDVSDPWADFIPFLQGASALNLAYVHVIDMGKDCPDTLAKVRAAYSGKIIANNMLKGDSGAALLDSGAAQAIAFGRAFIANPDLVERLQAGAPLAKPDYKVLYTGEENGYTDYSNMVS